MTVQPPLVVALALPQTGVEAMFAAGDLDALRREARVREAVYLVTLRAE